MRDILTFSATQYAFLQRDGCLEATTVLHAVLRNCHDLQRPAAMAFLDLSKAFDSITPEALGEAAEQAGIPPPMLNYIGNVLRKSMVTIGDNIIHSGRGVRQGDPLSPILFILAMERPISAANRKIGINLESNVIHSIVYADDMVLMAESQPELQEKLDGMDAALADYGMGLNTRKSAALTIAKDGRTKSMLLLPAVYNTNSGRIVPMRIEDTQKYLGLAYTWKGRMTPNRISGLEEMLNQIKAAPLKPQQRMMLIRDFLVPRLIHGLVLGNAHRNTMKRMDVMIRRSIREWMRLPKDTPIGLFYAPFNSGGLRIPCLETTIPILQRQRFAKLLNGSDGIIQAVTRTKAFRVILRRAATPIRVGGTLVFTPSEANEEWANRLLSSMDGRDLSEPDVDEGSHLWVKRPDRVFPRLYIRGVQLRGGTLSTKSRASRGRHGLEEDRRCRGGCQSVETLTHILQSCSKTHDVRCARHNRVLRLLCKKLHRGEYNTSIEPIVPCLRTHIKPDIIVHRTERLLVMDVTVVAGHRLRESWDLKVTKYGTEASQAAIKSWLGSETEIDHLPVIISGRGVMYGPSGRGLRRLGFSARDIMDLC
ncbi:MAG: RNA-directed DNA polymerase, partial [Aeromonas popoffii]|uniref:RNA-directed DNA polymerase n=1 Tax=Aeromonas popoffii TaxID=70856 RepID=UPI003F3E200C